MPKILRLAKEVPGFMELFNKELNPNIDIDCLSAKSKEQIKIKLNDNKTIERRVRSITANLEKNKGKYLPREGNPAKEVPGFLNVFNPELNPDIDIDALYTKSSAKIKISLDNGRIIQRQVNSIVKNLNKNNGHLSIIEPQLMKDIPGFLEIFNQELNPDVDIDTLTVEEGKKIKICLESGSVVERTLKNIAYNLKSNNGKYVSKENIFAKDIPAFLEIFDPKLNPDIDLNTLKMFEHDTSIKIKITDEEIVEIQMRNIMKNIKRNNGVFISQKIYHHKKNYMRAIDSPEFSKWIIKENNPDVDLDNLGMHDSKTDLVYIDEHGIKRTIKANSFFRNVKRNGGKFISRYSITSNPRKGQLVRAVIPGINDAQTLDPDIILFWGNNKKGPDEISPYTGHQYNFICPYCGYEFRKAIKNVAMKSPKCPSCYDNGFENKEIKNMPVDVAFLLRSWDEENEIE